MFRHFCLQLLDLSSLDWQSLDKSPLIILKKGEAAMLSTREDGGGGTGESRRRRRTQRRVVGSPRARKVRLP